MRKTIAQRLSISYLLIVSVLIILTLPFHEFLTTWIGSSIGHLDLLRAWKEILLLVSCPVALYIALINPKLKRWILKDKLVILICIFSILCLVIGIWAYKSHEVNAAALADGWITDLRFFVFLVLTLVVTYYRKFILKNWQYLLIIPATLVVAFGLAQLLLPLNFLAHFGYGAHTIPAYSTVDQNLRYHRIQSTLRGANPLGAYLVLTIPAAIVYAHKHFVSGAVLVAGSLISLVFTYSRSAWLGVAIAILIMAYFGVNERFKKPLIISTLALVIIVSLSVIGLRHNKFSENLFFHTDTTSTAPISSNAQRDSALVAGLKDAIHHPLGQGPGSAGPASEHNNHPPQIAENFYIQIAQETGFIGLGLFLAINIIVAWRLYKKVDNPLALVLFSSFLGISFINLLSHAWADDTLSLVWWGLAGVMLAPDIIKHKPITKNEKISKKPAPAT